MAKCIIMCAGEFAPLELDREEGDLLIAADNGLSYLGRMGILPDLVIGDYDSLGFEGRGILDELRASSPERIVTLPKEKDDTDTMAAVRIGLERGYKKFYLYSALGGRLDHTMANIQTLVFLKEHGAQGYILSEDSMLFVLRNEEKRFSRGFAGTFSLFALDKELTGVTLRGMKYNMEDGRITNGFPIGVSNEIDGSEEASVSVKHGTGLVIVTF